MQKTQNDAYLSDAVVVEGKRRLELQLLECHDVLCEGACLVAEQVVNAAELLGNAGVTHHSVGDGVITHHLASQNQDKRTRRENVKHWQILNYTNVTAFNGIMLNG